VLLSIVAIAPPLLLRSVATSPGITGPLLLIGATIAALGLAGGALFRSPRPYELVMVVLAYVGVQGKGPLAVAALSPAVATGIGITLAVSLLLVFATMPRLAGASERAAV
jgi:hypothetical protein